MYIYLFTYYLFIYLLVHLLILLFIESTFIKIENRKKYIPDKKDNSENKVKNARTDDCGNKEIRIRKSEYFITYNG